jgi:GAF domain-containing protein
MDVQQLLDTSRRILNATPTSRDALQALCSYLREAVPHYDWVGIYEADGNRRTLSLGPFAGDPTEHVGIPFGRGVCGQVAESQKTVLVDDVSLEGNYLSCSPNVRSEIVVPIMVGNRFVAEIDIDSHTESAFGPEDRRLLEALARMLSPLFS